MLPTKTFNAVKTLLKTSLIATGVSFALASNVLAAEYSLNLSTSLTPNDPSYQGFEAFKKGVEQATDHHVEIKLFPSGQLGADNDILQYAQAGSNVGIIVDGARLAQFVPQLGVLTAPFLFPSYASIKKFVGSPVFHQWIGELPKKANLNVLSFNWFQGARMLVTKKPIKSPADLHGVRVRALEAPMTIKTISCMGGSPTPLAWSEIYSSMQTGVVDAAEAQPTAIYGSKLYEISKYITKTRHFYLETGIVVSHKWFASLPDKYQQILIDQSEKAGESASQATIKIGLKRLAQMQQKGVVIESVNTKPFAKACANVVNQMGLTKAAQDVERVIHS
ncbi:C4-dicarboxylate TRAP transporter substrate-binding protein [Celerinatantimonas yamalensis]|uniref:C4-dicarboxylate TRAP transporter substrate-binding protein n=1 Tax=Celerinatantimonas yamalensis TaxID=559956 RepID=A0ABW9G8E7_9GAMM